MTLRTRVTWILLATLAPLGLAVGVGLYQFVRTSLMSRLDDALAERAELLGSAVRMHDGKLELDVEDVAMPQYEASSGADPKQIAYFEIFQIDKEGKAVFFERSPSLGSDSLLNDWVVPSVLRVWNSELSGEREIRILARRMIPNVEREERSVHGDAGIGSAGPGEGLIVVAVSRETVEGPLRVLAIGLLTSGAIMLIIGSLAARWAVTRGLAPVGRFAEQVGRVDVAKSGVRLETGGLPAEIAPIQARVNELLGRVEEAMAREKRFSAAAAHELRTPVAELRTLLEVAASRPRSVEESARTIATAVASVERLDRLVGAMLRLLRIESGREEVTPAPVPLREMIDECIESVRAIADARGIRFAVDVTRDLPAGVCLQADEGLLRLALRNLVANAAEYADDRTQVTITVSREGTDAVVRIANAAAISGADAARIGEPLWRPDQARANSEHLGLGLTLAGAAARAMGARLDVGFHAGEVVVEVRGRVQ